MMVDMLGGREGKATEKGYLIEKEELIQSCIRSLALITAKLGITDRLILLINLAAMITKIYEYVKTF
jgi:hypothetical protein